MPVELINVEQQTSTQGVTAKDNPSQGEAGAFLELLGLYEMGQEAAGKAQPFVLPDAAQQQRASFTPPTVSKGELTQQKTGKDEETVPEQSAATAVSRYDPDFVLASLEAARAAVPALPAEDRAEEPILLSRAAEVPDFAALVIDEPGPELSVATPAVTEDVAPEFANLLTAIKKERPETGPLLTEGAAEADTAAAPDARQQQEMAPVLPKGKDGPAGESAASEPTATEEPSELGAAVTPEEGADGVGEKNAQEVGGKVGEDAAGKSTEKSLAGAQRTKAAAQQSDVQGERTQSLPPAAAGVSAAVAGAAESSASTGPAQSLQAPGDYLGFGGSGLTGRELFREGVRTVLEFLQQDGVQEARIIVDPPALGRIDVSLQSTPSGVEANFRVDNEVLRQTLQMQMEALRSSLESQGINVYGISVDIRQREDERRQDASASGRSSRRVRSISSSDGEEEAEGARLVRLDLEKGLLHWVA